MPEQSTGETTGADVVLPQFDFAMRKMTDALTAVKENQPGWQQLIRPAQAEYDAVDPATITPGQLQQLDRLAGILERAHAGKRGATRQQVVENKDV